MWTQSQAAQRRGETQGQGLLVLLRARGIDAGNVTRNRRTGVYAVQFAAPDVNNFNGSGTAPAQQWASKISACFDSVEIVDTHDSVADWRPGKPVLFATVYVRGNFIPKAS